MKKLDKQFFQSVLIAILSLAIFIIIVAGYIKIDEYRKLSYKVDTRFLNNDVIKLSNKFPISDEIGKKYSGSGMESGIAEYLEFTVSNPNDKKVDYEIYITKRELETGEIKSNYIKLYLTDGNNNPVKGFENNVVKSYYDLYSLTNKPGSRLLYKDSLASMRSKKYILRSWVADTYILSKDEENFIYDIDVRIK